MASPLWAELLVMPLQYYVVSGLSFIYILMMLLIIFSRDKTLHRPFYTLWIMTGICGVTAVLAQVIMKNHRWLPGEEFMFMFTSCLNSVGAAGVAIGKIYALINLYCLVRVGRVTSLRFKDWSKLTLVCLALLLLAISLLSSLEFFIGKLNYSSVNGTTTIDGLSEEFSVWSRSTSTTMYVSFIVLSVFFSVLIVRNLHGIASKALLDPLSHRAISKKERQLIICAIADCIAFGLKCLQQMFCCLFWNILFEICCILKVEDVLQLALLLTVLLGASTIKALFSSMYVFVNGLAIFSSPFLQLVFSANVRRLFLTRAWSRKTRTAKGMSTATTVI